MRVFVLTTGRSGSTTFTQACAHATNFTAGHEAFARRTLPRRLDYPDQHIEVDNRLFFYLGLLDERFGADAFYVHLTRDPERVASSYVQRWMGPTSLSRGWARMVMKRRGVPDDDRLPIARDAIDAVNAGIRLFLKDKPQQMTIRLEDCPTAFGEFWDRIGAQGDRSAALAEFDTSYNASRVRPA
jgi:hypothetical protein